MIIDCISDLHGFYPELQGGDLLIVAGDLTARDTPEQYHQFIDWISSQRYKRKIFIAGNHDNIIFKHGGVLKIYQEADSSVQYLCDSGTEFEGLKIWGSPWSLWFPGINPHCTAFTGSEEELIDKWEKIPDEVDILVTHTPPHGIMDANFQEKHCGSKGLLGQLIYRIRPFLHVFGHIHEDYGQRETMACREGKRMHSVNASVVNERYEQVNKPIRIEL